MKKSQIEAIELDNGVWKLYPVLIRDNSNIVLIDTGLPENRNELIEKIQSLGIKPEEIDSVILTHQDLDHIGNANYFAALGAKIYASKKDAPYIEGKKDLIKYTMLKEKEYKTEVEEAIFADISKHLETVRVMVDYIVEDEEILDLVGGLQIISTPGHTPGHISIYSVREDILISGDAVEFKDGQLVAPDLTVCVSEEEALLSFQRIKEMQVKAIIAYHFGCVITAED